MGRMFYKAIGFTVCAVWALTVTAAFVGGVAAEKTCNVSDSFGQTIEKAEELTRKLRPMTAEEFNRGYAVN